MNATAVRKIYQKSLAAPVKKASEPAWLAALRKTAYERFKAVGFPTRKQEAWKYIYLESLLNGVFVPEMEPSLRGALLGATKQSDFKTRLLRSSGARNDAADFSHYENRLVFVNSALDPKLSTVLAGDSSWLAHRLDSKAEWAQKFLAPDAAAETNPFVSINTFHFQEGVFLRVPKNTAIEKPLHVIFLSNGRAGMSPVFYPRILVAAEESSKVDLVLHALSLNEERYFMNGVVEFSAAANAHISCTVLQQEKEAAFQFLTTKARLAQDSRLELVALVTGGGLIRNESVVDFLGANASCAVAGLSVLSGNSQAFHHVHVNHRVPVCSSRQVYKNILAGKSVAEFNSLVHVWRDAQKTDAEQVDKNLLLSDGARIYSRPQLKIDNDDVRAAHGAATGHLEKNELFYLQSRGLAKDVARFLLIRGFAQEILDKIKEEGLRKELEGSVGEKIKDISTGSH